jgi:hypothetical protein
VAITHTVVLAAALLSLVCLPCVVAAAVCSDRFSDRFSDRLRARRRDRELRRLDRALRTRAPAPGVVGAPPSEQIAYDLRRLGHQRSHGPCRESERWRAAVLRAYDQRLCLACRALGVTEHLEPLEGMDRDLERLRVESELQAAGLALR